MFEFRWNVIGRNTQNDVPYPMYQIKEHLVSFVLKLVYQVAARMSDRLLNQIHTFAPLLLTSCVWLFEMI